jgi:hypothetical protein
VWPLSPDEIDRPVNVWIWCCHGLEGGQITNQIWAEQIEKNEQIGTAHLERRRCQKKYGFGVLAKEANTSVREGALIPDVLRFIDNYQVESWRRIEIEETLPLSSTISCASKQESLIELRVRDDHLGVLLWLDPIEVCLTDAVPQLVTVKGDESLIESSHFDFPFPFRNQRLGTDDEYATDVTPRLELPQDQTRFDCFTDSDAICD